MGSSLDSLAARLTAAQSATVARRGGPYARAMTALRLYTDGSCPTPGTAGGWAWIVVRGDAEIRASGPIPAPTNHQKAELIAAIEGLTYVVESGVREVELLSDSKHVVEGMRSYGDTGWAHAAAKRAWRTTRGKPFRNPDLWERLLQLEGSLVVTCRHVPGPPAEEGHERRRPLQPRGRCASRARPQGLGLHRAWRASVAVTDCVRAALIREPENPHGTNAIAPPDGLRTRRLPRPPNHDRARAGVRGPGATRRLGRRVSGDAHGWRQAKLSSGSTRPNESPYGMNRSV